MPKAQGGTRFYAVAKGRQPGLYYTWEDCEAQVTAFPGAKHKKVRTYEEAVEWLAACGVTLTSDAIPPSSSSSRTASTVSSTTTTASTKIPSAAQAGPSHSVHRASRGASKPTAAHAPVDGTWIVYCDGACKGNGQAGSIAGVGVYWGVGDPRNIAERCPGVQTNNRAELIAIVRVLETVPIDDSPLLIRSDSNYSIKCVTEWLPNWRRKHFRTANGKPVANKELVCYIDALLQERKQAGQTVKFEHVYGHRGDVGNEGADQQANLGCEFPEEPDRDWEMLEADTRTRAVEAKVAMQVAEDEAMREALCDDDKPRFQTPPPRPQPVIQNMAASPSSSKRAPEQSRPQSRKKFKPAKNVAPQFTSPTSSPPKAATVQFSDEDLASYADCLGEDDELEAELAGL